MRYQKVLFISPKFPHAMGGPTAPLLLSFAYLSQVLVENNIECEIFDLNLGYSFKDLEKKLRTFLPDLVGFTIFSFGFKEIYKFIEKLKLRFPWVNVAVGGPHVSICRENVLNECASIDFGCVGEGEELLVELCQGVSFQEIKGLLDRQKGEVVFNGLRDLNDNLDSLPFPKYPGFEMKKYPKDKKLLIITSRGCPYNCIFCCGHLLLGKKIRTRTPKNVVDEIEYHYRNGIKEIFIMDDNFTFYKERVCQICNEIERRGLNGLTLNCTNGLRADRVDRDLLKLMKKVGFKRIGIGVEGGNNKVLKLLKRGESIEVIEKAIETTCELGFEVELYFVVGAPGETYEDIQDSIKLALKYPVTRVDFYSLLPFPGTELYSWVEEHNAWLGNPSDLLNNMPMPIELMKGYKGAFETKELPPKARKQAYQDLRETMRIFERRKLKSRLKRLAFLSGLMAYIGSSYFVRKMNRQNRFIRAVIRRLLELLSSPPAA